MNKHICPCCSSSQPLLRHISHRGIYWFCSHCHREMPDLGEILESKSISEHSLSQEITTSQNWGKGWRYTENLYSKIKTNKRHNQVSKKGYSTQDSSLGNHRVILYEELMHQTQVIKEEATALL